MKQTDIDQAAALLVAARRTREPLERLPEDLRPSNIGEAHAIEAAIVAQLGEPIAGWKVGRMPDGEFTYGIIVASRVVRSGGSIEARDMPLLGMEQEIAFRLLRDAPPRAQAYSRAEVTERVAAFAAIEVVATRYRDYHSTPVIERTADFMSNGAFVVGDDLPEWRTIDLANIALSLDFDDTVIAQGNGGHATGDPLQLAVDLVNEMRTGAGVRTGQMITTGSYSGLHSAQPGLRVTARFEGFPAVSVRVL